MWKNYKRHNREKHGDYSSFRCAHCDYQSKRNHDIERHVRAKHKGSAIAKSLVEEIVSDIFSSSLNEAPHQNMPIFEYERIRNQNVLDLQAALLEQCPTFWEEINSLRLQPLKKVKNAKKKVFKPPTAVAVRKSSRIAAQAPHTVSQLDPQSEGICDESADDVEHDGASDDIDETDHFRGKYGCLSCDKYFR